MTSISSSLGSTYITMQFTLDRNIDAAAQDVQAAIAQDAAPACRRACIRRRIRRSNPADVADSLSSRSRRRRCRSRSSTSIAETMIAQRISMVPGVAQVQVYRRGRNTRCACSSTRRALAHREHRHRRSRDRDQRRRTSICRRACCGAARRAYTLQANGQLQNAGAFRQLVVAYRNGAPVRLGDLGRRARRRGEQSRLRAGTTARARSCSRCSGSRARTRSQSRRRVNAELDRCCTTQIPAGVKIDTLFDRSVGDSRVGARREVHAGADARASSSLVIFLFLRNVSATLIPSLALPISLVGTFAVMYVLGYSLDNLSLMALTLAVGFVVDDAIVMLENIVRHMEMGKPPMHAAIDGAAEVGFTIISMTISLTAVFIPILFLGGIVGRLFHEFAVVDRGGDSRVGLRVADAHADAVAAASCKPHDGTRNTAGSTTSPSAAYDGCSTSTSARLRWAMQHPARR